ncbi:BON domain-containing protein [Desulfolucanica intricata]|uniref:BON domain-containing protein n=1 Tax=Desulfolucanica intricata TaxID=1285191 RepID=UPI00082B5119|nr:BON domain-containing protein [Desulfolucanica intricata]
MSGRIDRELQQTVESVLNNDKNLKGYGLQAYVNNGEVEVTGIVDSLSEKEHVNRVLSKLNGVRRVNNGVSISTDGAIDDEDVEFEVAEELNADPAVNLKHVGAKSVRGTVFLQGHITDQEEKKAAIKAASKARGVTNVVSRLKLEDKNDLSLKELFHSQVNNDRENPEKEDFIVE